MTIGELFVRITADPSGVKKGTDKAAQELTRLESVVKRLGGALAGAFAAKKLFNFARDSVREFSEAEGVWARLAGAVEASGTSFAKVSGQINQAAEAMENASRFSDEDFAAALQNLVVQTGDVGKSMGLMGLAADLASERQITLQESTQLLGKALAGNTTQLTKMFPALKNSTDLFGDLQKIVKDMAEKDVNTLEGRLAQLNNAWSNFKEAVGSALTGTTDMSGAVVTLTEDIKNLTKFIDENRGAIKLLISPLTIAAGSFQFFVGGGIKGLQALIDKWKEWRGLTETPASAALSTPVTPPPVVASCAAKDSATAITKVWTDYAAAMKTAAVMSQLLSDTSASTQDQLATASALAEKQISLQQSALEDLVKLGVDPASKAVQELVAAMKLLQAQQATVTIGGTTPGPEVKTVESTLDKVPGQLTAAFQSLTASLGPMALVSEFIGGVFAALAPVLDALMVPIRDIGFLLGQVLAPVLKLLQPVIDAVAKAFSFVIQGIGEFLKGLGKAINFMLPGNPANGLVKFGQNMIDMAKQTRAAIDAGTDLTKTFDKISQSASNVPEIFDLVARRRAAGTPLTNLDDAYAGVAPTRRQGITVNVNNPASGVDVKTLIKQVVKGITDAQRRGGSDEFSYAVAGAE